MIETLRAIANDNTPTQWITAGVILVAGSLLATVLRRRSLVLAFLRKRVEGGDGVLAPFVVDQYLHTFIPVIYGIVLYGALSSLTLAPGFRHGLNLLGGAIVVFAIFRLLVAIVVFFIDRHVASREAERPGSGRSIHALVPIVQVMIWGTGLVFLLENFGFRVDAIITGLGIGGVAIALAAQSLLKDFFSYVAIVLDRPFEIGDIIQADAFIGSVEYIGLKTTHIRSLGGEQIIFANSDLTSTRVLNWKRMSERRVVFGFTISGDTGSGEAAEIPDIVRNAVEAQPETRFDRAHFAAFAGTGLSFEVVYYVLSPDYGVYMDRQQAINLEVKAELDRRGIRFAAPAQAIVVSEVSAEPRARTEAGEVKPEHAVAAGLGTGVAARGGTSQTLP
jgi:small-conductance mechanosensitive channel